MELASFDSYQRSYLAYIAHAAAEKMMSIAREARACFPEPCPYGLRCDYRLDVHPGAINISERDDLEAWLELCNFLEPLPARSARRHWIHVLAFDGHGLRGHGGCDYARPRRGYRKRRGPLCGGSGVDRSWAE